MVAPSFRFPYHCADVQHNHWIIYIKVQGQGQRLISKRKFIGKFRVKDIIILLIITSQGTRVQHNKMICRVQTLVCMVKVTGHDNNSLNIHNRRPIVISLENDVHHDKTMCHISPMLRSKATLLLKTCCLSIICKSLNQLSSKFST